MNEVSSASMAPKISDIDHIHVYVHNWRTAEEWYRQVMGFRRVERLMPWAVKGGPLTLENPEGTVHLALFERDDHSGSSAIAFDVSGADFLAWKTHLEATGLTLRVADHKLSYSLYFFDPDQNIHEITSYERDFIALRLRGNDG